MTVRDRVFEWGARTYIMGIVNVSPESFSGDGVDSVDAAVAQARRFEAEGADIIDVGGAGRAREERRRRRQHGGELAPSETVRLQVVGRSEDRFVEDVDVEVSGFALMGGNGERGSMRAPRPGAPRIKVFAYSLMGGIDVWRLPEEARGVSLKQAKKMAKQVG